LVPIPASDELTERTQFLVRKSCAFHENDASRSGCDVRATPVSNLRGCFVSS
jgi:hypothetical protein